MKKNKLAVTSRILEILVQRGSPLANSLKETNSIELSSRTIREQIAEELSDELGARGLNTNSEPNKYGLEMEMLIDACGLAHD